MRTLHRFTLAGLLVVGLAAPASAGWGHVKGQIVLDGEIPPVEIKVKQGDASVRDAEVCAVRDIPSQELVIDPETKGIAHCFLYPAVPIRDVHPDLAVSKEKQLKFDNKDCVFLPHAMVIRNDQTVLAVSSDACGHNVNVNMLKNKAQSKNAMIPAGSKDGVEFGPFPAAEPVPMQVDCNIHSWMQARWLVVDTPYACVTDAQGNFEMSNLPAGTSKFKVWHVTKGFLERSLSIDVKDGETTAVTLKYTPDTFVKK